MATKKWMNEVQQITLILSTMASRMFMAGDLMEFVVEFFLRMNLGGIHEANLCLGFFLH